MGTVNRLEWNLTREQLKVRRLTTVAKTVTVKGTVIAVIVMRKKKETGRPYHVRWGAADRHISVKPDGGI